MITVNNSLFKGQLSDVLCVMLEGQQVSIIRFIPVTGRNGICWIYIEDSQGNRRATFISRQSLNIAFMRWLGRIKLDKLRARAKCAISNAMLAVLSIGELVWHRSKNLFGTLIEKGFDSRGDACAKVDWGERITKEEACYLEVF